MKPTFYFVALALLLRCSHPQPVRQPVETKQFALLVTLKNDPVAVARYEAYHLHVWPEVEQAFRKAGILDFKIYRFGYQTFLLITTRADFDLDRDLAKILGPRITEWDKRMSAFQALTGHEQWQPVKVIYEMKTEDFLPPVSNPR